MAKKSNFSKAFSVLEKFNTTLEMYSTLTSIFGGGEKEFPSIEEIKQAVADVINDLVPKIVAKNEIEVANASINASLKFLSIEFENFMKDHERELKYKDNKDPEQKKSYELVVNELLSKINGSNAGFVELKKNISILSSFIDKVDCKEKMVGLTYYVLAVNLLVFFYIQNSIYTQNGETFRKEFIHNAKDYLKEASGIIEQKFEIIIRERVSQVSYYRRYEHSDWTSHYILDNFIDELREQELPPFFVISPKNGSYYEKAAMLTKTARQNYLKMIYPDFNGGNWTQNANVFKDYLGTYSNLVTNIYFPMDENCVYRRDLSVDESAKFEDWMFFIRDSTRRMVENVNLHLKSIGENGISIPNLHKTFDMGW